MSAKLLHLEEREIYNDLVRKFVAEGHEVYVMVPFERRSGRNTTLYKNQGVNILGVKTLNVEKSNIIEKGLGQLLLEGQFKAALKKYLGNVKFDLILYSTPPITFCKVIECAKKMNPHAVSYLMLKDIFPQNAVDLGMLQKTGIKGLLYRSFRKKEVELYRISDWIGCMSPANVNYVIRKNPKVNPQKVEICPNSYEISPKPKLEDVDNKRNIRKKYNLPLDLPIFIYGGNMGKPQGIPFLIKCLEANKNRENCHFLIVGNGVDYPKLEAWYKEMKPKSVSLFQKMPKTDYDQLADACDVGLIFLDYRFSIPNYPSRLLPYLMGKKPIIACTDPNCDTGELAVKNGYGLYCKSNDVNLFTCIVDDMLKQDRQKMGERGYQFFLDNYTVQHTYDAIMQHM